MQTFSNNVVIVLDVDNNRRHDILSAFNFFEEKRIKIPVILRGNYQSSDFGGELTESQLKYCANDVIFLHKIHNNLIKILEREKRIDLYNRCINFLDTRIELDQNGFKFDIFEH